MAGGVFGVTLAALIPFWIIKGTQPTGDAVLTVLYGVLIASGITWLGISLLWRHESKKTEHEQLGGLRAGGSIEAGGDIEARSHIEAGGSIKAGGSVRAGEPHGSRRPPILPR
jgi:hypothetical protein